MVPRGVEIIEMTLRSVEDEVGGVETIGSEKGGSGI